LEEEIKKLNPEQIPDQGAAEFRALEDRLAYYRQLLSETPEGRIKPPPNLFLVTLLNGQELKVKITHQDAQGYLIETLVGIGMKISKSRLKIPPAELSSDQAAYHAETILEDKCETRGIVRQKKDDLIVSFSDSPKRSPIAMAYFDMAEFSADNGLAEFVPMLLDQARKKDPNIAATVHEIKAARLIDLVKFWESIPAHEDAREEVMKINSRYFDTAAFAREQGWLREKFGNLVRAPAASPEIVQKPPVVATKGDTPKKTEPTKTDTKWVRPIEGPATPEAAKGHIAKGDEAYAEAEKHLDPANPNELRVALKYLNEAFQRYVTAQEIYDQVKIPVPQELMGKVKSATEKRVACRKMVVSSR
jgi:hypothetical protein